MNINYDLEQRFAHLVVQTNALATLLIAKGIITADEYKEAQDLLKEDKTA